jgi:hypothetical protein
MNARCMNVSAPYSIDSHPTRAARPTSVVVARQASSGRLATAISVCSAGAHAFRVSVLDRSPARTAVCPHSLTDLLSLLIRFAFA